MARTRVRLAARVALVAAVAAATLAAGRAAGGTGAPAPAAEDSVRRHVVRAGDTLWAIARARVGAAGDPRPLVEAIREANGIGPRALRPGLELRIPAVP